MMTRVKQSLPLHSSKPIEPILTVCLIRIHCSTLCVVYNYMMPWPLHCKIREELMDQKRNFTKCPFYG